MLVMMLVLTLALQAQAPPAGDVKALVDEYRRAEEQLHLAIRDAKTDEDRLRVLKDGNLAGRFLPRFRESAAAASGDAEAEALGWVFKLGVTVPGSEAASAAEAAAAKMLAAHPQSPRLADVAASLLNAHRTGQKWAKAWLREAARKAEDRPSRAAAMLSLAVVLSDAEDATREDRDESLALLKTVAKDYAGTTAGDKAARRLFELENLQIGCTAPDFEAKDVEGKPFKLSDYRGKVVVLDFWGFWCPGCRDMIPRQKELLKRLEGRPFALIGVNSDPANMAKKICEDAGITWRTMPDGTQKGPHGPLSNAWNVTGWPTIYVLDAKGVIRFKNVRGKAMDEAVDALLKEME